jgi:hypothetical protein
MTMAILAFVPYDKKICGVRLLPEKGGTDEVVIESRDCLTRINIAKFHERRFILRFKNKGHTKVSLLQ